MEQNFKITERFRTATLGFVNSELDTAETFADIALQSDDFEKISRNRVNARKGFDEARRFLATIQLTPEEERSVSRKCGLVEAKLMELGETF